jgi:hypothetical protein
LERFRAEDRSDRERAENAAENLQGICEELAKNLRWAREAGVKPSQALL